MAKYLHFAGYDFTSGPGGTVIHRPRPNLPDWYAPGEYGSDPLLDDRGEPTGKVRMVPTGRVVDLETKKTVE